MHESRYFEISYFKLESLFRSHENSCESSHLNRIFFYKTALHAAQSVSFSRVFPFWYIQLTLEEHMFSSFVKLLQKGSVL